ncbi:unnamed protein product [Albugo candida]|uniref:RxLR effector protein n=1 Tax=Albugo candida TaxID=65357 RepID=A0A024GJE0_9STRA|nr:unnamed protein product [Albugo candida]|eukprot:CCI46424.1 unnamed protein product [Albugo candida]
MTLVDLAALLLIAMVSVPVTGKPVKSSLNLKKSDYDPGTCRISIIPMLLNSSVHE